MSMEKEVFGNITLYCGDCMEFLRETADKAFDLAVVDPPYGLGRSHQGCGSRRRVYDRSRTWDDRIPGADYFAELARVSRHAIIWGMNYFPQRFPVGHFIVWDKLQPDGVSFAQAELASTTFSGTSKIVRIPVVGQQPRIHPTQKPVALYEWLLARYAKPGDRILDTHLGSGSSAIACEKAGLRMTGIEIDAAYYAAARQRIIDFRLQQNLF